MRLRLLAIVWMMLMTIVVDAATRNRRDVDTLLGSDRARRENFELFGNWGRATATTTEADPRASHTIQLDRYSNSKSHKRSPRKSLESISDEELFPDPNEPIDPESLIPHVRVKRNGNGLRRSLGKSPSYVHRIPRRTYERFLSEEMNPADESEAEYGGSVDDDIDVPGVFLNDEITNKRNRLEDVYPEVKSRSVKRDHSPPEFLKPTRDDESSTRRKRDKEQEGDCDYEEEGEEYYYDEEDENQKGAVQGRQAAVPKAVAAISEAKETVDESQSDQEDLQTFENSQDAKIEGVSRLNSPAREKYVVAVKGKSSSNSAAKKTNNSKQKHDKPKPKKKPPAPKKTNNKKPPPKSKPHPPKKPKPKPRKPKSNVAALVDNESDQLKNQKGNGKCCGEVAKKERNKITKTLIVKAIPKSESVQELQIYEKPSSTKKSEAGKPVAKSNIVEGKADMSMGEMKDLLTRLIGKVDDLRSLISEIRSDKVDRVEANSGHINCIAKARRRAAGG